MLTELGYRPDEIDGKATPVATSSPFRILSPEGTKIRPAEPITMINGYMPMMRFAASSTQSRMCKKPGKKCAPMKDQCRTTAAETFVCYPEDARSRRTMNTNGSAITDAIV